MPASHSNKSTLRCNNSALKSQSPRSVAHCSCLFVRSPGAARGQVKRRTGWRGLRWEGDTPPAMALAALAERLAGVRERMETDGVDFYLVPSSDAHQNEYVPACWQRRAFISGFTGSAGDALIGRSEARLWTDSRYWLQAEHQLDASLYQLMKGGAEDVPTLAKWLAANAKGGVLGLDPRVVSLAQARELRTKLEAVDAELRGSEANYVDAVWSDAPGLPQGPALVLSTDYAGQAVEDKLAELRETLAAADCDWLLLTTLDAIAWTFNLRGRDVAFNPLVISYALLGREGARLFVDPAKVTDEVAAHLARCGVVHQPYDDFGAALDGLAGRVWLDPKTASLWAAERLEAAGVELHEAQDPVLLPKARKNPVEQQGMRDAHERDGVALVRFLHWLEGAWGEGLDEIGAADRLEQLRSEGERFQGLSFPTISGFAAHGAIVHYGATSETSSKLDDSAIYLVDSGAQYLDGTTDVTRTVHLGTPTPEERRHYTLVLKGHLALRAALFPKGTTGAQLDALARAALWQDGLDYGHGTGHGVGHYLNVHEGPQGISSRSTQVALEPGMVVSNEPGLYLANRYGIRIENLVLVVEVRSAEQTGTVPFYGFEDLTLVPYCRKLIDRALLERSQAEALDAYHERVRATLGPQLSRAARSWLERETAPIA